MTRGNFGTTPRRALTATRRKKAFEMLLNGFSEKEIFNELGSWNSLPQLKADLRKALKEVERPVQEYKALQIARYEALLRSVWTEALDGDLKAHSAALDVLRDQSKVMDLGSASASTDNSDVAAFMAYVMGTELEANADDIQDEVD